MWKNVKYSHITPIIWNLVNYSGILTHHNCEKVLIIPASPHVSMTKCYSLIPTCNNELAYLKLTTWGQPWCLTNQKTVISFYWPCWRALGLVIIFTGPTWVSHCLFHSHTYPKYNVHAIIVLLIVEIQVSTHEFISCMLRISSGAQKWKYAKLFLMSKFSYLNFFQPHP